MDKQQFLKWAKDFAKERGGYIPKKLEEWYDIVENKSKELQKQIPFNTIDLEVTNQTYPINNSVEYYNRLNKYIPEYFRTYGFYYNNLSLPTLIFKNRKMSTAKHILTFLKMKKCDSGIIQSVIKILSDLGKEWAANNIAKEVKRISVLHSPLAYFLIGNYSCDKISCFGQGNRINPDKRFSLGVHPDTFILLSHTKGEIEFQPNTTTADGRMLGVINDNTMRFSNGYGFFTKPNVKYYLESLYNNVFGVKSCTTTDGYFKYEGGLDYIDYPVLSISKNKIDKDYVCKICMEYKHEKDSNK